MDLKKIGVDLMIWMESSQDKDYWRALVNAGLKLQVTCGLLQTKQIYE